MHVSPGAADLDGAAISAAAHVGLILRKLFPLVFVYFNGVFFVAIAIVR